MDCEWGDWVAGECSTTCGPGVQIDARQKVQEELYGGTCEGNATKETDCSKEECPSTEVFFKGSTIFRLKLLNSL